jgi:hypothetical protein
MATGMNVIGDHFTRLYPADSVTVRNVSAFEGISRLCDRMQVNWRREEGWLQFRSAGYFNERPKEVPNRLLERWAALRKKAGHLTPDELIEIATLSDAQLQSASVALGARALYGLEEWELARMPFLRPHWRFLAATPPSFRNAAASSQGAGLGSLPPSIQQKFFSLAVASPELEFRLEFVPQTVMRVVFDPDALAADPNPQDGKTPIDFRYTYPAEIGGKWVWTNGPFHFHRKRESPNTPAEK